LANVAAFDDVTVAGKALAKKLEPGDVVLIKGSRAAKIEGIIEVLSEAMNT
jgi:UDP-N-acetylmuramyl pentapeptide synthase